MTQERPRSEPADTAAPSGHQRVPPGEEPVDETGERGHEAAESIEEQGRRTTATGRPGATTTPATETPGEPERHTGKPA